MVELDRASRGCSNTIENGGLAIWVHWCSKDDTSYRIMVMIRGQRESYNAN